MLWKNERDFPQILFSTKTFFCVHVAMYLKIKPVWGKLKCHTLIWIRECLQTKQSINPCFKDDLSTRKETSAKNSMISWTHHFAFNFTSAFQKLMQFTVSYRYKKTKNIFNPCSFRDKENKDVIKYQIWIPIGFGETLLKVSSDLFYNSELVSNLKWTL